MALFDGITTELFNVNVWFSLFTLNFIQFKCYTSSTSSNSILFILDFEMFVVSLRKYWITRFKHIKWKIGMGDVDPFYWDVHCSLFISISYTSKQKQHPNKNIIYLLNWIFVWFWLKKKMCLNFFCWNFWNIEWTLFFFHCHSSISQIPIKLCDSLYRPLSNCRAIRLYLIGIFTGNRDRWSLS